MVRWKTRLAGVSSPTATLMSRYGIPQITDSARNSDHPRRAPPTSDLAGQQARTLPRARLRGGSFARANARDPQSGCPSNSPPSHPRCVFLAPDRRGRSTLYHANLDRVNVLVVGALAVGLLGIGRAGKSLEQITQELDATAGRRGRPGNDHREP